MANSRCVILISLLTCLISLRPYGARALTPTSTATDAATVTETPTATPTATSTTTNPPGSCCGEGCTGLSFEECQAADGCIWDDPCLECGESPGSVFFRGLDIEPPQPKVGDDVTLQFDVERNVFMSAGATLEGASPFLEQTASSDTTFQMVAVQAGRASVSVVVGYHNEQACTDPFGNTYYSIGPLRTATSPQYEIDILEASTPTPSQTPTATAPSGGSGGDGCQLGSGESNTLASPLSLLVLVLFERLRRRSR